MKKIFAIFAVLCIMTLSACFSPWTGGGEGTITISFGTAEPGGRIAVQPDDIADLTHHITLTGPGGAVDGGVFPDGGSATFVVAPGTWTISIRAEGPKPKEYGDAFPQDQMLRAIGLWEAEVRAGENVRAEITMISAVEVATHAQLSSAISNARTDGGEKIIFITGNIPAEGTYTIPTGTNITLVSDEGVTITRTTEHSEVMFDVSGTGNTLTIGRPGMRGSITIDGYSSIANGSIIRVRGGAKFVMNQNVTLTRNQRSAESSSNGGAVEVGEDGIFTMNDGTISNNSAGRGGGVYVASNGTFTMNGGVIYGINHPDTQNLATSGGASLFVASNGTARYGGNLVNEFGYDNISTTSNTLPHKIIYGSGLTITLAGFDEEITDITNYVFLSGPGEPITYYFTGSDSAIIDVVPGVWTITIRTMGSRPPAYDNSFPDQMLRAIGFEKAEVRAGENVRVEITMISAVEVATHAQLSSAISNARTDGYEKIIFITDSIIAEYTYNIPPGTNITLASNELEPIEIGRIMLHDGIMFNVRGENSTFTLGRSGMTGSIIIDGIRQVAVDLAVPSSIIRVSDAHLVMNEGVTLTGNLGSSAVRGGAVYVGTGGSFSMYGGVISNNHAAHGGGVYVYSEATEFRKTGGVIYGSGAGIPSSSANTAIGPAGLGGATGRGNALALPSGTAPVYTFNGTVRGTPEAPVIWLNELDTPAPPPGGISFTISFADFHEMEPIQVPPITEGGTVEFSLENPDQYDPDSIVWSMGETRRHGETFVVGPDLHRNLVMTHFITVEVSRGGTLYSQVIALEVIPGDGQ
ncbi:MAG: hypothetical protein FWB78_03540 [Treponema sp.]|nr:hypothetical protein [Treponema sp.]